MLDTITRNLTIDQLIFLDCDPRVCHQRIQERGRPEEASVSLDYLQRVEKQHHSFFEAIQGKQKSIQVSRVNSSNSGPEDLVHEILMHIESKVKH